MPTDGKVTAFGEDFNKLNNKDMSKLRRTKIGFVFQFYNLVMNLTVRENILLPVLLNNEKPKNYYDKLDELLEMIDLKGKENFTPRELSGGQQQRTAIARSLIYESDLIFADEPIGNLDYKSGTNVMELLKSINEQTDTTIVQVTHSEESAEYGTRLVKMLDGEIESDRTLEKALVLGK